jgi:hypothetical protein
MDKFIDSLFSYAGGWDGCDGYDAQFYDCTLKTTFGRYNPGDKIAIIVVSISQNLVQLFLMGDTVPVAQYKINVSIGERVN